MQVDEVALGDREQARVQFTSALGPPRQSRRPARERDGEVAVATQNKT